jgi:hypothetical protein
VIRRDDDGKIHVTKTEKPTQNRGDRKELDAGTAAVIVIDESRIGEQLQKAMTRANKLIEKRVDADADGEAGDRSEPGPPRPRPAVRPPDRSRHRRIADPSTSRRNSSGRSLTTISGS